MARGSESIERNMDRVKENGETILLDLDTIRSMSPRLILKGQLKGYLFLVAFLLQLAFFTGFFFFATAFFFTTFFFAIAMASSNKRFCCTGQYLACTP